ncbi:MAG: type II toxin-antitoxin system VapC family toxin [Acidothermales bacterium]|nr:type II toxin-antitoxin system VapC family toxin [Acidothermales bacterium]
MTVYLETSAAAKLLVEEAQSASLAAYLDHLGDDARIVSSVLLETELRRLAVREGLPQDSVTHLLDRVDLFEPDRALFHQAGILPGPRLRTLDALHVAAALRAEAAAFVCYDQRQREAAKSVGLRLLAPA